MLKLTDDGAQITLTGRSSAQGDGLFWFGSALLIGAVAVAMAMSLLPERLAIGALGLLIIGSFIFNWLRQQQKKKNLSNIHSGLLEVKAGSFVHQAGGSRQQISLAPGDRIELSGSTLCIFTASNELKSQISGFESEKEAQVMQALLKGQTFGKRNANIRMQSN